jgi:hypothetical protein
MKFWKYYWAIYTICLAAAIVSFVMRGVSTFQIVLFGSTAMLGPVLFLISYKFLQDEIGK